MLMMAILVCNSDGNELMIAYMAEQYIQMFMVAYAMLCYELAVTVTIAAQSNCTVCFRKAIYCGACSLKCFGDFPFFWSFLLIVVINLQYR